jgi:hypothetical protein
LTNNVGTGIKVTQGAYVYDPYPAGAVRIQGFNTNLHVSDARADFHGLRIIGPGGAGTGVLADLMSHVNVRSCVIYGVITAVDTETSMVIDACVPWPAPTLWFFRLQVLVQNCVFSSCTNGVNCEANTARAATGLAAGSFPAGCPNSAVNCN